MGGSPCIAGSRIRVADVVRQAALYPHDPIGEMRKAWPHITREQLEAALAFYEANQAEIDEYIREEEAIFEEGLRRQGSI